MEGCHAGVAPEKPALPQALVDSWAGPSAPPLTPSQRLLIYKEMVSMCVCLDTENHSHLLLTPLRKRWTFREL